MNKLYSGFFYVIAVVCFFALVRCNSVDADLQRDNPRDPRGTNFIFSPPAGEGPSKFEVDIIGDVISINWEDISEYVSGYIVEKAINDSTQFDRVAVLPEDAQQFRDESGEVGLVVYYRITVLDTNEEIIGQETLKLSIQAFEGFSAFSRRVNDVEIEWLIETRFSDGFLIEEKSGNNPFETVKVIDFDSDQKSEGEMYGSFVYQTDKEAFILDVRATAFQYRDGERVPIQQIEDQTGVNKPDNLEIRFISELETKVDWDNSVDFADHYQLTVQFYESGEVLTYEIDAEQLPITLPMEMQEGQAVYTLKGVKGSDVVFGQKIVRSFHVYLPRVTYSSTNLSTITLHFDDGCCEPGFYSAIIVERAVNGGVFEVLDEMPPSQKQYTDMDLTASNSYAYRIRSLTSQPSREIVLNNRNRMVPVESREIEYVDNLNVQNLHFPTAENAVYYRTYYSNRASYDLEIIETQDLDNLSGFNSDSDYFESQVTPSVDRVVQFTEGTSFGEYDLELWDINSKTLLRTISAAHIETNLSFINPLLGFSRSGDLMASAIRNKESAEIKLWNSDTGALMNTIELPDRLDDFQFNPEKDELLVTTRKGLYIYDTQTFELAHELANPYNQSYFRFSLTGNGQRLFMYSRGRIIAFDIDSKTIIGEREMERYVDGLSTNIDGSVLLIRSESTSRLYDANLLDLEYIQRINYGNSQNEILTLNPKKENNALSIDHNAYKYPADVTRWERRNVWYQDSEEE